MENDKTDANHRNAPLELTRRDFCSALGASAIASVLAGVKASAQSSLPLFQDSFGNIGPAAGDALNVGAYPPPIVSSPPAGPATVTPGYAQPNILMIMVDELRTPRWLPPGGQAAVDQLLPNIAFLREHSFNFPNYFVAATNCTPCRATILSGLYSQQTFMFAGQDNANAPSLQTGFPTLGTALSQQAGYRTCWIGKWHVSDFAPYSTGTGKDGPLDYGFNAAGANLPTNTVASPSGIANEGNDGNNAAPFGSGTHSPAVTVPSLLVDPYTLVNDAAIANSFMNNWLPSAPSSQPWFAAVSFINPHDICDFPLSFGLAGTTNFGTPGSSSVYGFQPPPVTGYPLDTAHPDQFIPPLVSLYPANGPAPTGWNSGDDPSSQRYGVKNSSGWGKPGMQAEFQSFTNKTYGSILNTNGWYTYLNYYFWLQSCVDYHIGRVMTSLGASPFASNTIVIFTADHGDYAGSHNMRTKGGALYDESLNVPLYISYPAMRPPFAPTATTRVRPYVCSSVDLFPFLYTLALGNNSWRNNSADPYSYLSGREAILDGIFSQAPSQRRLSTFPNQNGAGFQPYILHTWDESPAATIPGTTTPQPSHAIAFRTVDTSVTMNVGGVTFSGGAKLGMYNYWPCGVSTPDPTKSSQYEFYNYTAGNVGEVGNSALVSATQLDVLPGEYLAAFNAIAPTELYVQYPQFQSTAATAKAAYFTYITSIGYC